MQFELIHIKIFRFLNKIHLHWPFQLSSLLLCWIRHCNAHIALHTCMNSPTSNCTLLSYMIWSLECSFKIASQGSAWPHYQGIGQSHSGTQCKLIAMALFSLVFTSTWVLDTEFNAGPKRDPEKRLLWLAAFPWTEFPQQPVTEGWVAHF